MIMMGRLVLAMLIGYVMLRIAYSFSLNVL
jgi:hypothetical protein